MRAGTDPINICFASDDNFVKPLATAIASLLYNNKDENLRIYVLDDRISEENKEKIASLNAIHPFSLTFIPINLDDFKDCVVTEHIKCMTVATYFRYRIPSLLPEVNKLLYLDCDIVINSSLRELWETDITDHYIAGVHDLQYLRNATRLEMQCDSYVNAGVFLINNKLWREDSIEKRLFETTAAEGERLKWGDQDAINLVCEGKVKLLDDRWNYQYSNYVHRVNADKPHYYDYPMKEPAIIHFVTRSKPWMPNAKAKNLKLFWHYFMMTPWKDEYTAEIKRGQLIQTVRLTVKDFFIRLYRRYALRSVKVFL